MLEFDWKNNITNREEKLKLAKKIASRVKNNEIIGFGSGSTSYLAIEEIAKKIKNEKLNIKAIPTSTIIENLCKELNIPITTLKQNKPDWCFDGADEVDKNNWLIKGMGAALYREKLNIKNCKENYILVDDSKFVNYLGEKNPVPVECDKDKIEYVSFELQKLGAKNIKLQMSKQNVKEPLITDNGKVILHVNFIKIYQDYEEKIKNIDGVLESGLFIGYPITIVRT